MDSGFTPVVPSFGASAVNEPLHELRSLETLECYKLVARLGRGGMAEVLLAAREIEPFVHRPVVVKRLYEHFAADDSLVQMFLDEARLLCQLEHTNIVKTFEAGIIDGQCCIAMEYLEGQPLQVLLRRAYERGKLPIEVAAYIVIGMLEGLHHAHDAEDRAGRPLEVVHRDVSPHNVFVTSAGIVKILDFGIAKAASHAGRTATGMVKGKAGYMAPEQANAEPIDRRVDVWSAGVVLWEALTGSRLFKAETDAAAIHLSLTGEIPRASSVRADIPSELDVILGRALRRVPAERYQSALEMKEDLERWLVSDLHPNTPAALGAFIHEAFESELIDQRLLVSALMARSDCTPPSIRRTDGKASPAKHGAIPSVDRISSAPIASLDRISTSPILSSDRFSTVPPTSGVESSAGPERTLSSKPLAALVVVALFVSAGLAHLVTTRLLARTVTENRRPPPVSALTAEPIAEQPHDVPARVVGPPRDGDPYREPASDPVTAPVVAVRAAPTGDPTVASVVSVRAAPATRAVASTIPTRSGRESPSPGRVYSSPAPTRADATEEFGFLTIDSSPWSIVSAGGRVLGQTPLVGIKLPAGLHVLSLRNPDLGRQASYTVTIEAGKTVARRVGLE